MMNITVDEKKDDPLFGRKKISFTIEFDKAVPSREQAKAALASAISASASCIVILKIENKYGQKKASCTAYAYENADDAKKSRLHLLVRDKIVSKEDAKKAKQPKAAAKEAPKK